jgi:RNA polymerase sigma-70 factor, ECF subfamily
LPAGPPPFSCSQIAEGDGAARESAKASFAPLLTANPILRNTGQTNRAGWRVYRVMEAALTLRAAAESRVASPDDRALARRIGDGDTEALGLVYDRYAPALHRLLVALLGSPADAEDALQEIFLKLAAGRAGRMRDLRAYLFTAARHEAFSHLRRARRERPLEESDLEAPAMPAHADADMQDLLQRLPVEQREVIALKVYGQFTFAEIAAIVRAPQNTVASRYRYGIARLRQWCREAENVP